MEEIRFRVVTGTDPDLFEERLNRLLEALPEGALLLDVKFSTTAERGSVVFSALVYYKIVASWDEASGP